MCSLVVDHLLYTNGLADASPVVCKHLQFVALIVDVLPDLYLYLFFQEAQYKNGC